MDRENKLYYLVARGLVKFGAVIMPDEVDRIYNYVGVTRQQAIEDMRIAMNAEEKDYTKYMKTIRKEHG